MDAPTYGLIDKIVTAAGMPYMALHDIDANKPAGSFGIRVRTYAYTLKRREEQMAARRGLGLNPANMPALDTTDDLASAYADYIENDKAAFT